MNDFQNLSHPEIEFRPSFLTYLPAPSPPRETLLDLLEVYPDRIKLKPKLDHSSLIDYFSVGICAFLPTSSRWTQSWFNVQKKDEAKQGNPQPLRVLCVASLVTPGPVIEHQTYLQLRRWTQFRWSNRSASWTKYWIKHDRVLDAPAVRRITVILQPYSLHKLRRQGRECIAHTHWEWKVCGGGWVRKLDSLSPIYFLR